MDERDLLIWMAGFFDGEGCVSIGKSRNKRPDGSIRDVCTYTLQLAIEQKQAEPLKQFHRVFGGSFYTSNKKGMTYFRWSCNSSTALRALERLLPYLMLKRPIAELGIRFQTTMAKWNKEQGRRGYSPEAVEGRELFYLQARALNAKQRANNRAPKYAGPRAVAAQSA
jgi:hypothetical protein